MDIISRREWGAVREKTRPKMPLPAREVWLHHSVTQVTADPRADMRQLQKVGIQRFGYISYSWAIHPAAVVLEGQGLRVGAHTAQRNSISFGLVLIGDYRTRVPNQDQLDLTRQLIDWLADQGHLRRGVYPTGGHRDAPQAATICPGPNAYAAIPELRLPWQPPPDVNPEVIVANAPFVAVLCHPAGGYHQVGEDGGMFSWGDAPFFGSLGAVPLNQPISGAAWTPDYGGYWLCSRDGGVFSFGNAQYHGGMGGVALNQPIVGMAATNEGGYILIGRDGGIFPFGPGAQHQGNALWAG